MWLRKLKPIYFVLMVFGLIVNNLAWADFPYYNTRWPVEHRDGERHQVVDEGGLLFPGRGLSIVSTNKLESPAFALTREKNELYLVGGKFGPTANGWIAKVHPLTLTIQKQVPLNLGGGPTSAGGCLMHANGYIYAIVGDVIYKFDAGLNLLKSRQLIMNDAYNGVLALSDGNLIMKGGGVINRSSPSVLTILNTELEPIIEHFLLPEQNPSRISVHRHQNREYVYCSGLTTMTRYEYVSSPTSQLVQDAGWFYQYRDETSNKTSRATAPTFLGENLFTMDNAEAQVIGPTHIIRVNLNDSSDAQMFAPFKLNGGFSK